MVVEGSNSCRISSRFGPTSAFKLVDSGDVAAGSVQAGDKSHFDRVGSNSENDGNARRGCLRSQGRSGATSRHDDRYPPIHQLSCKRWQSLVLGLGPAIFNADVLAFGIACIFESLSKRV